ncbi:protein held out wings isoform X2 [Belonocnema kinseyi]|uniref:protein held out wings isoform X2 n=1 Tax=Belonocnema kinseyi TaxID=2817044 RepID=UPI00143D97BF|nr:protein held out wings isoform X2 [Belonocnema kinseyi]
MCDNTNTTQSIADYLSQLLKDRKQLAAFPNVFIHVERLLDEEIAKVRASLFQISGVKKEPLILPEQEGDVTTLTEKVYVPVKEHPDFNFVGRILGPRGMTAKQLEQETGCKIMVRGKGSMRDKKKEEQNRGKPNWEHLTDELHVLLTVEDTENRATMKLARAVEEVKKLLVPQADGEDELKKRQLMELAIINGTYRDSNTKVAAAAVMGYHLEATPMRCSAFDIAACDAEEWRRLAQATAESQRLLPGLGTPMRTPSAPLGAPLILSPRISVPTTGASLLNGSGPPTSLLAGDPHGLIYTHYPDYANYAALAASPLLTEYATADHSGAAAAAKQRRHLGQIREHPYQRAGALS